jgi:ribosomal protein S18 acetylase RimI-like enzyme
MENIIRPARRDDSSAVWKIRNHPANRCWFNTTEAIGFDSHDGWFENKYFKNNENKCFVLAQSGAVAGYCRFDLNENDEYIISIALDPDYQGRGLGGEFLSGALRLLGPSKGILAEVKKKNLASLSLFKKNNFIKYKYKEDKENIYLKYKC